MEGAALLLDLRPEALRSREPLEALTSLPVRAVTCCGMMQFSAAGWDSCRC